MNKIQVFEAIKQLLKDNSHEINVDSGDELALLAVHVDRKREPQRIGITLVVGGKEPLRHIGEQVALLLMGVGQGPGGANEMLEKMSELHPGTKGVNYLDPAKP